jgi:Tfp pilus assembly PilM family ATPase
VIAEPVTRFEDELKRTIAFLAQHRRGLSHSRLVLFGGGASIKNVAPFLSDRLEMSVETWRPQDSGFQTGTQPHVPIELMGPAIALSSLGWDRA